jgi:DNA-nicking Smr family endonuclease
VSRNRDSDLFREAMSDVEPLDHDRHVPEIRYREPVSIGQIEREVLRELDALVRGEGELVLQDSSDYREAKVPGLDPRSMKQLRRGEFTIQADLDLHGKDATTARGLVERFVIDTRARGLRCVRIVHGRGRNSPGGVSVLQQSLPRWLARGPARLLVLAYCTAPPNDGGAGATYVLLRRR